MICCLPLDFIQSRLHMTDSRHTVAQFSSMVVAWSISFTSCSLHSGYPGETLTAERPWFTAIKLTQSSLSTLTKAESTWMPREFKIVLSGSKINSLSLEGPSTLALSTWNWSGGMRVAVNKHTVGVTRSFGHSFSFSSHDYSMTTVVQASDLYQVTDLQLGVLGSGEVASLTSCELQVTHALTSPPRVTLLDPRTARELMLPKE